MIQKRVLVPMRVRHLPKADWSWVDRRFLREFAPKLSGDAVFLYYILVAVSDKNGLSFYGDMALREMLRASLNQIKAARQELLHWNLIAYEAPLAQVLSLPSARIASPQAQPEQAQPEQAESMADSYQQLLTLLACNASANGQGSSQKGTPS